MAHDTKAGFVQTWGPPLVTAIGSVAVVGIGSWFTVGQRLASVETGLTGLREIVATRFTETDRRIDETAANIKAQLDDGRVDVREIRQLLMDAHPSVQPESRASGVGKRRR
jgi:hypothetical protein